MTLTGSRLVCEGCKRHLPRAARHCPWCSTPNTVLPDHLTGAHRPDAIASPFVTQSMRRRPGIIVASPAAISNVDESRGDMEQYGVLPWRIWRDGSTQIMLVTSRRRGRWIIPKGGANENEPAFLTASREAFEEAGIIGDIYPDPLTEYGYLKTLQDGSLAPCRVTVFSMEVHGTLHHWREKGQRRRQWFTVDEAAAQLDDAELAAFVLEHGPSPKCEAVAFRDHNRSAVDDARSD